MKRPIVQYDAQQGSELIIKGDILLESDKPKSCFTVTFKKGDVVDYFRCKDCNINCIFFTILFKIIRIIITIIK